MNLAENRPETTAELFVEVGVEEFPSDIIADTLRQMKEGMARRLTAAGLAFGTVTTLGTPRRLVLVVSDLATAQAAGTEQIVGPPARVAFDAAGVPTAAAVGFAKSQGVAVADLLIQKSGKGEYVAVEKRSGGEATAALLPRIVPGLLAGLSFPKSMRWNDSGVAFARPIRSIAALYRGEVVPFDFAGVASGTTSCGHRFLAPDPFPVTDAATYFKEMGERFVVVDPQARHDTICRQMAALAEAAGGRVETDEALVWQAVYTTESPQAMRGSFDKSFLDLPTQVITTVMKEHQGFTPVYSTNDGGYVLRPLRPAFLCVLNLPTKQEATIRRGNERVLRARLLDARFYYDRDRKATLQSRTPDLMGVTFHTRLGNLYEKTGRIAALCTAWADRLPDVSKERAVEAAWLCKCDLTSGVVREFPSLQGVMGAIYAGADGLSPAVATAISEHYRPRFSGDDLPQSPLGQLLAVADKLDTIVGFFGVGLLPSGSEDPYALRRQGLGVVQIWAAPRFGTLPLSEAIADAAMGYVNHPKFSALAEVMTSVSEFLKERMASWLEGRNFRYDLVEAVLSRPFDPSPFDDPYDRLLAVEALAKMAGQPRFAQLLTCVKRARRILPAGFAEGGDAGLLKEPAERALDQAVAEVEAAVLPHRKAGQYDAVLETLVGLAGPLDRFFGEVRVIDDDEALRLSRFGLLLRVRQLFDPIADFSKIAG